eukprot:2643691-Amphidinium_carterae.2
MGTTGGDKDAMIRAAEASGTFAVIAPNMGKQVVAFQATMAHMAKTFPDVFQGCKYMNGRESNTTYLPAGQRAITPYRIPLLWKGY